MIRIQEQFPPKFPLHIQLTPFRLYSLYYVKTDLVATKNIF